MVWGLNRLVLASVRAPALCLSPFCGVESVDCPTNPFTDVVET